MNFLYRLLLTFNATSLIIVVFLVKEETVIKPIYYLYAELPAFVSYIIYFITPVILTYISLSLGKHLGKDDIKQGSITSIEQANNAFLPSYLGYFFVALSIPYTDTLYFVFATLFIFTFLSQTLYFNPLFLFFGYHFYYLKSTNNVQLFIITRKELKDPKKIHFEQLRRINNFTFIDV